MGHGRREGPGSIAGAGAGRGTIPLRDSARVDRDPAADVRGSWTRPGETPAEHHPHRRATTSATTTSLLRRQGHHDAEPRRARQAGHALHVVLRAALRLHADAGGAADGLLRPARRLPTRAVPDSTTSGCTPSEVTIAELLKRQGLRDGVHRQVAPRPPAAVPADAPRVRPVLRHPVPERPRPRAAGSDRATGLARLPADPADPQREGRSSSRRSSRSCPTRFTARGGQVHRRATRTSRSSCTSRTSRRTCRGSCRSRFSSSRRRASSATRCSASTGRRPDLAAVEKHGLENNTLIVFTSRQRPAGRTLPGAGRHLRPRGDGRYARRHVLRGGKYQSRYEGGTRVACLMRWPGRVPPGTSSDALVAGFDLYTTFATLAGARSRRTASSTARTSGRFSRELRRRGRCGTRSTTSRTNSW